MLQRILNINTRHMKPSHTWDKNLRACHLCSLNFQEREQWQRKTNLNDEPFSMTKNCQNMNLDASTLFPCYNLISTFASNVLSMKLVIWYVILIRTYYFVQNHLRFTLRPWHGDCLFIKRIAPCNNQKTASHVISIVHAVIFLDLFRQMLACF